MANTADRSNETYRRTDDYRDIVDGYLLARPRSGAGPPSPAPVSKGRPMSTTTARDTAPPARPFKVVFDLHAMGDKVRVIRSFSTLERAMEYASLCNPHDDAKVYPNVRDGSWKALEAEGFEYWRGIFWHDNRPAVVMSWSPAAVEI